jgi:hypothetical protein
MPYFNPQYNPHAMSLYQSLNVGPNNLPDLPPSAAYAPSVQPSAAYAPSVHPSAAYAPSVHTSAAYAPITQHAHNHENILTNYAIPSNAHNAIMNNEISNSNRIVNFHDEFKHGRFYKKNTFNTYIKPTMQNPFTRRQILPSNIRHHTAKKSGGKRNHRKYRKHSIRRSKK